MTDVIDTIETSLSFEYVSSWSFKEALRELIQNCLDNNGLISKSGNKLTLLNKNTVLSRSSLFLGMTEKRDDATKIGQHGEGMKLALLVLARQKANVVIHNGSEDWTPYFKLNKYKVRVLCIDVTESKVKDSNFSVVIDDPETKKLDDVYLGVDAKYSNILNVSARLTEKKRAGKLFVSGLYVCDIKSKFGYNVTGLILERDRSVANIYDLERKIKDFWEELVFAEPDNGKVIAEMLYDGEGLEASSFSYVESTKAINNACLEFWNEKHPEEVAIGHGKTVALGSSRAASSAFIGGLGDSYFSSNGVISKQQAWWDNYSDQLSDEAKDSLKTLLGL